MNSLRALSPTNAAARLPRGVDLAVLSSRLVLQSLPPGAAVPLVYWRNPRIMHGVLRAAADRHAAVGLGLRVRVGEEYSPRMAGAFRAFFDAAVAACGDTGFSGPLFVRAELPYFLGAGDGEPETARRAVFAAYDAGFTSFSLKLPAETPVVQQLPAVLGEALQLELGVEIRHRVAGIEPQVIGRILGLLRGLGVAPDVMRPLDGPQAPADVLGGVAVGREWDRLDEGAGAPGGGKDPRVAVVTMDALIASVVRSVLDESTRELLRAHQERERTGLEEAYAWGLREGLVIPEADERLEVRIYAEFADALDRMGAVGTAARVRGMG